MVNSHPHLGDIPAMSELGQTTNLAVFFDYENFARAADFEIAELLNRLKERGRLVIKRAYADWGRFYGVKQEMMRCSVDLIELPSHREGKNRADIKLVVDAMETAMTKDYIDTIVIVSGDSDFIPLVAKLRELNRYVIVISSEKNNRALMAGYCDELIFYGSLLGKSEATRAETQNAVRLLERVVHKLDDDGVPATMSRIKDWMRKLDSSFSEQSCGFSQFKKFLEYLEANKYVRLEQHNNSKDYLVRLPNAPAATGSANGSGAKNNLVSADSRAEGNGQSAIKAIDEQPLAEQKAIEQRPAEQRVVEQKTGDQKPREPKPAQTAAPVAGATANSRPVAAPKPAPALKPAPKISLDEIAVMIGWATHDDLLAAANVNTSWIPLAKMANLLKALYPDVDLGLPKKGGGYRRLVEQLGSEGYFEIEYDMSQNREVTARKTEKLLGLPLGERPATFDDVLLQMQINAKGYNYRRDLYENFASSAGRWIAELAAQGESLSLGELINRGKAAFLRPDGKPMTDKHWEDMTSTLVAAGVLFGDGEQLIESPEHGGAVVTRCLSPAETIARVKEYLQAAPPRVLPEPVREPEQQQSLETNEAQPAPSAPATLDEMVSSLQGMVESLQTNEFVEQPVPAELVPAEFAPAQFEAAPFEPAGFTQAESAPSEFAATDFSQQPPQQQPEVPAPVSTDGQYFQ